MQKITWAGWLATVRQHWPYYLAEAVGLGIFVAFSCGTAVFFNHPAAPGRQWLGDNELLRRVGVALIMAAVVVGVSLTTWGQRSGAHINPAVTVAFWQLGSIKGVDAVGYILAQFVGAAAAGELMLSLLRPWYPHPDVQYNLTKPGPPGWAVALLAEFIISGVMAGVLLVALHSQRLKKATPWLLAGLIGVYIVLETPLSGMSLNPARSLGTALAAGQYPALWIYFVGPVAATWLAALLFKRFYKGEPLACAAIAGCDTQPLAGPYCVCAAFLSGAQ
ncbi:MAG: aquaporin family protein [Hymenobacter sp.]|nr:MAG: aquaporin family protein [Hymenobacter sp.]